MTVCRDVEIESVAEVYYSKYHGAEKSYCHEHVDYPDLALPEIEIRYYVAPEKICHYRRAHVVEGVGDCIDIRL